jgi:hypothetical protein
MIVLYGNTYRLCLLDTNAISEMVKHPAREFRTFCEWAFSSPEAYIPSFSIFSVIELRRRADVYAKFLELFTSLPCIVLKGYEELIHEEIAAYPEPSRIDPVSLVFAALALPADRRLDRALELFFASSEGREKEAGWLARRGDIVEGISSLVSNYPPEKSAYTPKEIRIFLEMVVFHQVEMRSRDFAQRILDRGDAVQIDAFPSLKMTLFTVFNKFYVDNRKLSLSDAFDLTICAATPYVDAIVTERHQAEVIKKIKSRDPFLNHLTVLTLRELRS